MTTIDVKDVSIGAGGRLVFEARMTDTDLITVPSAVIVPDAALGSLDQDGALVRITLTGPVVGQDPRVRANWKYETAATDDEERRLAGAPQEVRDLVDRIVAAVREAS